MNTRTTSLLVGLALAVAIAALAMVAWPRSSAAQDPTTDSRKRITVVGHGEVSVTPDIARVSIGVQSRAADAAAALADNNAKMAALIEELKGAGIPEKDIQTVGFNVNPTYNYDANPPQITGYEVSNMVSVKVPIADTGALLDRVVQVGANNISGLSFEVSDLNAALEQARAAAIADARARAEQYAQAGGTDIGEILVITEQIGASPEPYRLMADTAMAEGGGVPVQAGTQLQTIDVQVTFELR